MLEATYVAFRLQPHSKNYRKRLVKTPKLHFWDTDLVTQVIAWRDLADALPAD